MCKIKNKYCRTLRCPITESKMWLIKTKCLNTIMLFAKIKALMTNNRNSNIYFVLPTVEKGTFSLTDILHLGNRK